MRNASMYPMKLLAVLLCTTALGGCSMFSKKPAPAPAAPVSNAANAAVAAPVAKADAKDGKADAKGFKSLLTRSADEFALQEEGLWQTDVIDAILSLYHSNN